MATPTYVFGKANIPNINAVLIDGKLLVKLVPAVRIFLSKGVVQVHFPGLKTDLYSPVDLKYLIYQMLSILATNESK